MGKWRRALKGFTLVELMIVVAIIGILAAIAIPQYGLYREKAYVTAMQSDCVAIRLAEEAYGVEKNKYTDNLADLAPYGLSNISPGHTVEIKPVTNIARDFKVTVASSNSTKRVVYDSTTGQTNVEQTGS